MQAETEDLPPDYYASGDDAVAWYSFASVAYSIFLIWTLFDSYRRFGFSYWLWLILLFQPFGAFLYVLVNLRYITQGLSHDAGGGRGLFGLGLKPQISRLEQQMKIAETEALRAELAELYFKDKRHDDAQRLFAQVLEREPENQEALFFLARICVEKKDPAAAHAYFERLMALNRKYRFGLAWLKHGEVLEQLDRRAEALEALRQVSRSFPRPLTEFAYAKLLAQDGQQGKAREVLEYMLSTSAEAPAEDRTWLSQGRSLLRSLS